MKRSHYLLKCKLRQIIVFCSSYFLCNCPRKVLPSSFNPGFHSTLFLSSRGQFTSPGKFLRAATLTTFETDRTEETFLGLKRGWTKSEANISTRNVPARPCWDASAMKEAGRETVPESSHVSHFPWSCLSCCWLTDVVCSFQARISRVQLDLLQGESDNHIFFHSQQFDMDFVKWVCRNVRFCYLALSASCLPLQY